MEPIATIPPTTFVIVLAVTVLISLVAGYAARMWEEQPKSETQVIESPGTENPILPEEHVALKVSLDKSLTWNLEVDGIRVAPDEVTPEQRARLVNIIVQIRPWIDGKTSPAQPSAPQPAPASMQVSGLPRPTMTVSASAQKSADETNTDKLKISIGRGFRSLMANDLKVIENTKPPSIVSMIDDFLQRRLATSPLAMREIRLEEGSLGEVIVFVGKTRYPSVDDVPDPEIQAIIKAAIKDWEKNS